MGDGPLQLFAGNSNRPLVIEIGEALGVRLGNAVVGTFRNGEVRVRIEDNVRGADVFVLQSLCPPIHHHIWELLLMLDALKRASARARLPATSTACTSTAPTSARTCSSAATRCWSRR